jgi:hypothetical protein
MPDRAQPASRLPSVEDVRNRPHALYGRPFKCRACGSREVTLLSIDGLAELDEVQRELAGPPQPAEAPTNHRAHDPNADFA